MRLLNPSGNKTSILQCWHTTENLYSFTQVRQKIWILVITFYINWIIVKFGNILGKMQYLYDEKGNEYLDMFAGIVTVSVGHCHPKVNEALEKQINTLWHTTNIYLHPKIHEYAEKLVETLPDPLKVWSIINFCLHFIKIKF